jgi:DMSO/TMAO reductase YedYZ molybdopterin-dependent catalytic subunit
MLLAIVFGSIGVSYFAEFGCESSSPSTDIPAGDSEWRLLVNGSVYHPLSLAFDELVAMPTTTVSAELCCYGSLVDSGNWTGVRFGLILERAGPYPQADTLVFHATDGYSITLALAWAMHDDVIIAYEKDGKFLPETTRLVVPWVNGEQWISEITRIEIVNP